MQKRYRVPFQIRSYEVDVHQRAGVSAICNYFQEAAGVHAHHLNFDITHLLDNGLTWVLYKMHIRIRSNPLRWQDVEVETWPSPGDGLRAFRDYILWMATVNEWPKR
jgi:medium-chain acyl-[acyl-carrier-protein] hydrolase